MKTLCCEHQFIIRAFAITMFYYINVKLRLTFFILLSEKQINAKCLNILQMNVFCYTV